MSNLPRGPEAKKLLGGSVEESRAKRVEKQQSRYRDRGGIFVPADDNPLLDILLARGINGESPVKSPARRGPSGTKGRRKSTINGAPRTEGRAGQSKAQSPKASKSASKAKKSAKFGDSEENDQPVAGPSRIQSTKNTERQDARMKKSKSTTSKIGGEDSSRVQRDRFGTRVEDEEGSHPAVPRKARSTANKKGKQPTKSQSDANGDDLGVNESSAKGKRKAESGKGYANTGKDVDTPVYRLPSEAVTPWDTAQGKGRDESEVATSKAKGARRKDREVAGNDVEEELAATSKPRKTAVKRKMKDAVEDLDASEVPVSDGIVGGSQHGMPGIDSAAAASKASQKRSSAIAASEGDGKNRAPRKRPHLYISSDSETEDDMPLRRAKPPSRAPEDSRETEEASVKRAKLDPVAPIHDEVKGKKSARARAKPKGKSTKASNAKRKRHEDGPEMESRETEELRQTPEAMKTAVATQNVKDKDVSRHEEPHTTATKRGAATNSHIASDTNDGGTGMGAGRKGPKASKIRQKAAMDPGDEEDVDVAPGQPSGRIARKRRKATGADGKPDVAVLPVQDTSKSSHEPHELPKREKHEGARPSSRRMKENRKAPSTKTRKAPARKPMPRLSLFPSPSPGRADDSEDEIDFLR